MSTVRGISIATSYLKRKNRSMNRNNTIDVYIRCNEINLNKRKTMNFSTYKSENIRNSVLSEWQKNIVSTHIIQGVNNDLTEKSVLGLANQN